MNQASFFIEKKALFGGYPNLNQVKELKQIGVTWFIDLTNKNEKNIRSYSHLVENWLNYPIKDGNIPENKKNFLIFLLLIQIIIENLKPGEKIYLHCRGGHGRSTLVIACFLSMVLKVPPNEGLKLAKEYHALRPNLKIKWLKEWPLNLKQRKFVELFFSSLYLYSNFQKIQKVTTTAEFFIHLVVLNLYLHQHTTLLEVLLNSGLKIIKGEGVISMLLQELRLYILYNRAKRIFACNLNYF